MTMPSRDRSWARRVVAAVLVAALATAATGCGWRAETDVPVWPSPNDTTLARDAAALREYAILAMLTELTTDTPFTATLEQIGARTASAHLDALGGVYRAYPDDEIPVTEQSLEDAVQSARDGALLAVADIEDPSLALLLSSIGLSHSLALWYSSIVAAQHQGVDVAPGAHHYLPAVAGLDAPPLVPLTTGLNARILMDFAVAHDQARYLYQTIAARSDEAARAQAHERMGAHRARSDALVALSGLADEREAVYSVRTADVTGAQAQAHTARLMEQALGARYVTALDGAAGDDRLWLINAAFDAYAASALLDGFTLEQFPVLPGLTIE